MFSPTTFFGINNFMNNSVFSYPTLFDYTTTFSSATYFGVTNSNITGGKFSTTVFSLTIMFSSATYFGKFADNEIVFMPKTIFGSKTFFAPTTIAYSTEGIVGTLNKMRVYSRGLTVGEVKYLNTNNM